MINNLEIIKPLLVFDSEDDFYFLEVIKRRKENPENPSNARVIKSYYIHSIEYLDKIMPEIINLCELERARAYISLNRRSFEKIALQTLKKVTDCIISKDFRSVKKAYNSSCGAFSHEVDKKWIVDVDTKEIDWEMVNFIIGLQEKTGREGICDLIDTKNGYHLLTRPFNKQEFNKKYPGVDIQVHALTLLYI